MGKNRTTITRTKNKGKWKMILKRHQNKYWYDTCTVNQSEKSSLQYIQLQDYPLTTPNNIRQSVGNDPINIRAGEIKAKKATQTYMLQSVRTKYSKSCSSKCALCKSALRLGFATFFRYCTNLGETRNRNRRQLSTVIIDITVTKANN